MIEAGYWQLAAGNWLLAAGYSRLATGELPMLNDGHISIYFYLFPTGLCQQEEL